MCGRSFNKKIDLIESENDTSTEHSKVENNNNYAAFRSAPEDTAVDHENCLIFDLLRADMSAPVPENNYEDDSASDNNEDDSIKENDLSIIINDYVQENNEKDSMKKHSTIIINDSILERNEEEYLK